MAQRKRQPKPQWKIPTAYSQVMRCQVRGEIEVIFAHADDWGVRTVRTPKPSCRLYQQFAAGEEVV